MDGWMYNGWTDGHTDIQHETIIPCHYCVAGYKKALVFVPLGENLYEILKPIFWKKQKKKKKKNKKKKETIISLLLLY